MGQLGNTPQSYTVLTLEARKSYAFGLNFVDAADESPVDITGAAVRLVLAQPQHKGGAVLLTKAATIIDAELGTTQISLQGDELDLAEGEYPFAVSLEAAGDYTTLILKGVVDLRANADPTIPTDYVPSSTTDNLVAHLSGTDLVTVKIDSVDGLSKTIAQMLLDADAMVQQWVDDAAEEAAGAAASAVSAAASATSAAASAALATTAGTVAAEAVIEDLTDDLDALQAAVNADIAELEASKVELYNVGRNDSTLDVVVDDMTDFLTSDGYGSPGCSYTFFTFVATRSGRTPVFRDDFADLNSNFETSIWPMDVTGLFDSADLWDDPASNDYEADAVGNYEAHFIDLVQGQTYSVVLVCWDTVAEAGRTVSLNTMKSIADNGGIGYLDALEGRDYVVTTGPLGDLRLEDTVPSHKGTIGRMAHATAYGEAKALYSFAASAGLVETSGSMAAALCGATVDSAYSFGVGSGVDVRGAWNIALGAELDSLQSDKYYTMMFGRNMLVVAGSGASDIFAFGLHHRVENGISDVVLLGRGGRARRGRETILGIGFNVQKTFQPIAYNGVSATFTANSSIREHGASWVPPTIASGRITYFEIVLAVSTADMATAAVFEIKGAVKKTSAGVATMLGAASVTKTHSDAGAAAWSGTCTVSSNNLLVQINPGGTAVYASGHMERVEILLGNDYDINAPV